MGIFSGRIANSCKPHHWDSPRYHNPTLTYDEAILANDNPTPLMISGEKFHLDKDDRSLMHPQGQKRLHS